MKNDSATSEPLSPPRNREIRNEVMYHGIAASSGIAIGIALVVGGTNRSSLDLEPKPITEAEVPAETARLNAALAKTRAQILELQARVKSSLASQEASIFEAHLLIVDDKMLMQEVYDGIRKQLQAADVVFAGIMKRYITAISAVNDQYLKERAADVADVAYRVLDNLNGESRQLLDHLPGQRILISRDLTPSDTAMLDRENVQAFATETGSRTSHTAILARSMRIPAVVGVTNLAANVHNGDLIIIDGFIGAVITNPKPETLELYAQKEVSKEQLFNQLQQESSLESETIDGYRIHLSANIDDVSDIDDVRKSGAAGIGLFRTEYLFMDKIPTEEEQFEVYRKIVAGTNGEGVIIRTLDLGGDKLSAVLQTTPDPNPFLGQRSIRLCLAFPELLMPQLRAILRASAFGPVRLMFPMVTCEDEIDRLKEMLDKARTELRLEKLKFDENMDVGIMVETPSAALFAEHLARKVDFFSIGTNDLVQYTMAVDRGNEKVATLYRPAHPVILMLINNIVKAADAAGIWVGVCGEMASDPRFIPLLVGLGVQELSMSTGALGAARRVVRSLRMFEAEKFAQDAMKCADHRQVLEMADSLLQRIAPDIVSIAMKGN